MAVPPIAAVSGGQNGKPSPAARFAEVRPSAMSRDDFIAAFGGVFEGAPWIAETVWQQGLGDDDDVIALLHNRLVGVFLAADHKRQNDVIHNHPELAAAAVRAPAIAEHSRREQRQAGLDSLSCEEEKSLIELNRAYRQKFGFPFILAVGGLTKGDILRSLDERIKNRRDQEYRRALHEICAIAMLRLRRL